MIVSILKRMIKVKKLNKIRMKGIDERCSVPNIIRRRNQANTYSYVSCTPDHGFAKRRRDQVVIGQRSRAGLTKSGVTEVTEGTLGWAQAATGQPQLPSGSRRAKCDKY